MVLSFRAKWAPKSGTFVSNAPYCTLYCCLNQHQGVRGQHEISPLSGYLCQGMTMSWKGSWWWFSLMSCTDSAVDVLLCTNVDRAAADWLKKWATKLATEGLQVSVYLCLSRLSCLCPSNVSRSSVFSRPPRKRIFILLHVRRIQGLEKNFTRKKTHTHLPALSRCLCSVILLPVTPGNIFEWSKRTQARIVKPPQQPQLLLPRLTYRQNCSAARLLFAYLSRKSF